VDEKKKTKKKKKKKKKREKKNCLHMLLFQTTVMVHNTALYIHAGHFIQQELAVFNVVTVQYSSVQFCTVTIFKQVQYITTSYPSARHDVI
jgi:hypothetical protein